MNIFKKLANLLSYGLGDKTIRFMTKTESGIVIRGKCYARGYITCNEDIKQAVRDCLIEEKGIYVPIYNITILSVE